MKVIDPVTFTSAMLVSTTAVETVALWSSSTTYALGAKVRYGTRLYESLAASNLNKQPDTNPSVWYNYAPSNQMAMFDDQTSTATTATSSLTVVLSPGIINTLALVNLTGSTATISVKDSPTGSVVYSKTYQLDAATIVNWYQYYYEDYDSVTTVVASDIPQYATSQVTVTISGSGAVGVGGVVFGSSVDIGKAMYGLKLGTEDYSKVETDEFGTTTLTKRNSLKTSTLEVFFPKSRGRAVFRLMDKLRATPTLWIPSEDDPDLDFLSVYGIRRSFDLVVNYPLELHCSLELRGMT